MKKTTTVWGWSFALLAIATSALANVTLSPLSAIQPSDKEDMITVGTASRTRLNPTAGTAADTTEVILAVRYGGHSVEIANEKFVAMRLSGEVAAWARGERDVPNFAITIQPLTKKDVSIKVGKADIHALPVNLSYDTMIGQNLGVTVDVIGTSLQIPVAEVGPLAFVVGSYVHALGYQSLEYTKTGIQSDQIHIMGGDTSVSMIAKLQDVKIRVSGGVAGDMAVARVAQDWQTDFIFAETATFAISLAKLTNLELFFQFRNSKNPAPGQSLDDVKIWNQRVMAGMIYKF